MNSKKKKIIIVLTLIFSIGLAVYLVGLPERIENKEIATIFNQFEKAYNSGQYSEAYSFMTPRYKAFHDIEQFKNLFGKVEPLKSDWDVVRQFDKVQICSNNPGVSFSPNSTMTYTVKKVDGNWYLTGEWERFLD